MHTRKANLSDVNGIAKVHVDSWRSTYRNILPDEMLNNLSYEKREKLWEKNLAQADTHVFVTEDDKGEIVGFATGAKRDTNQFSHSADLTSIYVLENYQGLGVGKTLLNSVFAQFKELGYHLIFVEVLEENFSKKFYEAFGATLHSKEEIKIGGSIQNLLMYKWEDIRKDFSF